MTNKICTKCKQSVNQHETTCPYCRTSFQATGQVSEYRSPAVAQSTPRTSEFGYWQRQPGVLAQRLTLRDARGVLAKHIPIEHGTQGVLRVNGNPVALLDAGRPHEVASLVDRVKGLLWGPTTEVIVVDLQSQIIQLSVSGCQTRDHRAVTIRLRLKLRVEDAARLVTTHFKGGDQILLTNLVDELQSRLARVAQVVICTSLAVEVVSDPGLKARLDFELKSDSRALVLESGYSIQEILNLELECLAAKELQLGQSDLALDQAKAALALEREHFQQGLLKKFDELHIQRQEQELEKSVQLADLNYRKQRTEAQANELRQSVLDLELATFKRVALRDEERAELLEAMSNAREDREAARAQVLAILQRQRADELARLDHQADMKRADDSHELAKKRLLGNQELDQLQLTHRLQNEQAEYEAERAKLEKHFDDQLANNRRTFDESMRQRQLKHLQSMTELEGLMDIRNKYKAENLKRELDRQTHEVELEKRRLEGLSSASVEALIVTANPEQAALLVELRKFEQSKGMTDQQLLAIAAATSPDAANAINRSGLDSAAVTQFLERLLSEKDKHAESLVAIQSSNQELLKDIFQTALNTQRDTAMAAVNASRPIHPTHTPVENSRGSVTVPPAVCRQCQAGLTAGLKHCTTCGAPV